MHTTRPWPPATTLVLYTRSGFEGDAAAEITERAAAIGVHGFCRARPATGLVHFQTHDGAPVTAVVEQIRLDSLVFARQWIAGHGWMGALPEADRLTPILDALPADARYREVSLDHPDTNEGKGLSRFCRSFGHAVRQALAARGQLHAEAPQRLHLLFTDSAQVFPGTAPVANSASWHLGIPRLRMPRQAPSRSTLKLEEAFQVLLVPEERERLLRPGATAVDLGAAPGGWTWQLVRRGMEVTAIDNGPLDAALARSSQVDHRRADGFHYRPARPVDWLVCDMVERPARILPLVTGWLTRGDCRQAVFNLKLPMRQRYATVRDGLAELLDALGRTRPELGVRCRQLYHDREEVTVAVLPDA